MKRLLPLLFLSTLAHAEKRPRIAVLEVTIEGDAPPELRGQLGKSLGGGFYAGGYDVVERDEVATKLRGARALVGCVSTTCLGRLGTLLNAARFARVRVNSTGAAYNLELELYAADAPDGLAARVEKSCPVCTLREVNDLASKAALELVTGKAPALEPARVSIISRPSGARIEVDGVQVGDSPVEAELDPGPHLFHAAGRNGYRAADARRTLAAGERAEVVLTLSAEAVAAEKPVETSRFGAWKWVATGASVALVATGIGLFAIDGGTTDCAVGQPCMNRYATKGLGTTALIAGAALGGLSAYLFLNDRVETHISPTPGGAQIGARVSF